MNVNSLSGVELIERIVLPASMLKGNLLEVLKGWETSEDLLFDRVVSLDLSFAQYRSAVIKWRQRHSGAAFLRTCGEDYETSERLDLESTLP